MSKSTLWSLSRNGEIMYDDVQRDVKAKYKADTIFDKAAVPYIIMLLCALVDGVVFYSLFSMISYDSPFMLVMQMIGLLFGFDVVPVYIGIYYRRMEQRQARNRIMLGIALAAFVLSIVINVTVRLLTKDMLVVDPNDAGSVSEAMSMTVFGIIIPFVTSLGSFFVSYITYDPLKIRRQNEESMIADKRDDIRRLEATIADYDAEPDFAEHLRAEDEGKYHEMQKLTYAFAAAYCDYVRQRLEEHLGNPTSTNILSRDVCESLLSRLGSELDALEQMADEESAQASEAPAVQPTAQEDSAEKKMDDINKTVSENEAAA